MFDKYIDEKDYESIYVMERSYDLYHYDSPYESYLPVFNMSGIYEIMPKISQESG